MISEDVLSAALDYLAVDPHPVAVARKQMSDAENNRKRVFAELYRGYNEGTVKDRETRVETHNDYKTAQLEESEALFEYERHRARVRSAEMVVEVWRSANANARAAERVR